MDYSKGAGDKTIQVDATLSPEEALYIFSKVNANVQTFEFSSEKIFGKPNENNYAFMRKLRILGANTDSQGQLRKYPWYIEVENGKGIMVRNKRYLQSNIIT